MAGPRLAIAGTGWSAGTITGALHGAGLGTVVAACGRTIEGATAFASKHGIPDATADLDGVLHREDVDAVIVSTPHATHEPIAMRAMAAGKHVLVEKPLACSATGAERMAAAATRHGVQLGAYLQNRFADSTIAAREVLASGRLGRVLQASVTVMLRRDPPYFSGSTWRGRWRTECGSALINQSIHELDRLVFLLGNVARVHGFLDHLVHPIETDDTVAAAFRLESGVTGVLQASIGIKHPSRVEVAIHGSEGTMIVSPATLTITGGDGHVDARDFSSIDANGTRLDAKAVAHRRLLSAFCTAITGGQPFPVDGHEGARALRVVEAIHATGGAPRE